MLGMTAVAENETSWVVKELKNEFNALRLGIKIQHGLGHTYTSQLSPEYKINDTVSVQMRMCSGHSTGNFNFCPENNTGHIMLFIKFAKIRADDTKLYYANVTCKQNFIFKMLITDDKTWRNIDYNPLMPLNFDITIIVDVLQTQISPFASLSEDKDTTDLKLTGDDGSIELHSAALAAYSPVFKKKLCEKARESSRPFVIELHGIKVSTLQHLKKYIYTHTVPDSLEKELLLFASEYKMSELVEMCLDKVVTHVSAKNIYELLKFALINDIRDFYLNMLQLIENNVIKVKDITKYIDTGKNSD